MFNVKLIDDGEIDILFESIDYMEKFISSFKIVLRDIILNILKSTYEVNVKYKFKKERKIKNNSPIIFESPRTTTDIDN